MVEDRVVGRIARPALDRRLETAEDACEVRAEALDGATRARIPVVGLQRHPEAAPGPERVPEQQQLRLRVHGRALRALGEPGVPDLRRIEHVLTRARILALRPLPALQIEQAGGAHPPPRGGGEDENKPRPPRPTRPPPFPPTPPPPPP